MSGEEASQERLFVDGPARSLTRWVLLGGNRLVVSALVLTVLFVGVVALLLADPRAFDRIVAAGTPVNTLFQALVTVVVTGVTLVVSINSVVLSQELGPAGKQREKMDAAIAFREDVADMIDEPVGPADPSRFLEAMLAATADTASELRDAVDATSGVATHDALTDYADTVVDNATEAKGQLDGAEFGTFEVVSGSLQFEYSARLYDGKQLAAEHGSDLETATRDRLEDLLELLHHYGPAREHVKTLYFQWELVDLSRVMLYASIPALIVGITAVLVLDDPTLVGGRTAGLANQAWVVAAGATLTLSPFAILFAFIIRIGTVAKRTLAIGPFMLRERTGGQ